MVERQVDEMESYLARLAGHRLGSERLDKCDLGVRRKEGYGEDDHEEGGGSEHDGEHCGYDDDDYDCYGYDDNDEHCGNNDEDYGSDDY